MPGFPERSPKPQQPVAQPTPEVKAGGAPTSQPAPEATIGDTPTQARTSKPRAALPPADRPSVASSARDGASVVVGFVKQAVNEVDSLVHPEPPPTPQQQAEAAERHEQQMVNVLMTQIDEQQAEEYRAQPKTRPAEWQIGPYASHRDSDMAT